MYASRHLVLAIVLSVAAAAPAAEPIKAFILAGQSNMVGWGNSEKLPEKWRVGDDRVLMFEQGKWQPLKAINPAQRHQGKFGLTQQTFGPEISFAHTVAGQAPDAPIGIIKFAAGGSSILTWRPDWSKQDADRVGQGNRGSMFEKLRVKIAQARKSRDIEFAGFLWLQGGADMRHMEVAKEYLMHLRSLAAAVRRETSTPDLPFFCGTMRRTEDPDDISDLVPSRAPAPYPAVEWVLKAQWDARKEIPGSHIVVLRDIETHPQNVHYNTAGQIEVGRLFAKSYLSLRKR